MTKKGLIYALETEEYFLGFYSSPARVHKLALEKGIIYYEVAKYIFRGKDPEELFKKLDPAKPIFYKKGTSSIIEKLKESIIGVSSNYPKLNGSESFN